MSERSADQSPPAAVLLEKDGRFVFYQPDIGVIASDDSIDAAYAKFASARRGFLEEVERAGLTTGGAFVARAAEHTARPRDFAGELKLFLVKTCIVLLVVGAIGALLARSVSDLTSAIDQALKPLKTITLADVARKAADVAKDAQTLTKQEKESLRQSVGTISREIEPIVDAWRTPPTAISNPEAAPARNTTGR